MTRGRFSKAGFSETCLNAVLRDFPTSCGDFSFLLVWAENANGTHVFLASAAVDCNVFETSVRAASSAMRVLRCATSCARAHSKLRQDLVPGQEHYFRSDRRFSVLIDLNREKLLTS